jgi:hypothetical protein
MRIDEESKKVHGMSSRFVDFADDSSLLARAIESQKLSPFVEPRHFLNILARSAHSSPTLKDSMEQEHVLTLETELWTKR